MEQRVYSILDVMKQDIHSLVERLRLDLLEVRKSRDAAAAEALRSVLSAIDNA